MQTLITAQGVGPTLASSSSATSILPAQAKFTLPPNYFDYIGRRMRVTAQGQLSNLVTTPGTLTLDVRFGAAVVFNGGAVQLSTTAHVTVPWWLEVEMTLRVVGGAANFMGQGKFTSQAANISGADSATGHTTLLVPNSAPAVGANFDATATQVIDLFAKFSVADAANVITLQQFSVETNVLY